VHKSRECLDERVEKFGAAPLTEQRAALAELRREAAERPGASYLAMLAIVIPISLALTPAVRISEPWAAAIVGATLIVILGGVIAAMEHLISRPQRTALMWLGAYEDELERRRSQTGRASRRWRREH
jgi:hypothetical protein